LRKHAEVQLVAEVADGLAAVREAARLKPDLILLDIGLPNLNGIEAAERIREVIPSTKILFLAFNNEVAVVQAVMRSGAHGYVLKSDAGRELWPAIKGVLQGGRYLSTGIVSTPRSGKPFKFAA
jgi:DNA-binding NarL/FixJ family response regulator